MPIGTGDDVIDLVTIFFFFILVDLGKECNGYVYVYEEVYIRKLKHYIYFNVFAYVVVKGNGLTRFSYINIKTSTRLVAPKTDSPRKRLGASNEKEAKEDGEGEGEGEGEKGGREK